MKKRYKILLFICLLPVLAFVLYKGGKELYYKASFYYAKSQEKVLAEFPLGCKYGGYDLCHPVYSFKEFTKEDKAKIMKKGLAEFTKRLLFVKSNLDTCFGFMSVFNKKLNLMDNYIGKWEEFISTVEYQNDGGIKFVHRMGTSVIKFEEYNEPFNYSHMGAILDTKKLDNDGIELSFKFPRYFGERYNEKKITIELNYKCKNLIVKGDDYRVYKCMFNDSVYRFVNLKLWAFKGEGDSLSISHSNKLSCLSDMRSYKLYKSDEDFYHKYFKDYKPCYKKYPMYIRKKS